VPDIGKNRIKSFVDSRGDWCISRQRSWGVPIPVFYDRATGKEFLLNEETLEHVQNLFTTHGSDCWWTMDEAELLPDTHREEASNWKKGTDTMVSFFNDIHVSGSFNLTF
jgi:isoleucyl-tRNA synthetase